MSSREAILARIRTRTANSADEATRRADIARRLKNHPRGVIPAADEQTAVARFVDKAKLAAASIDTVRRTDAGSAILDFLRQHNLPRRLRMGEDERLKAIAWPEGSEPEIAGGPSDGRDDAGLSHAFAGVGETGTLVLLSGPENPSTVNFLPENHIVVVEATDIAGDYETVWSRIRDRFGAGGMPRTVNLITGPSRSADIEQTLIMGAHGPVRLHIVVVSD